MMIKENNTMQPGTRVKLRGKTKHGKNRIQHFGEDFWVSEVRDSIQTTTHTGVPGPFLMVFSETGDNRWVALNEDPDFEVHLNFKAVVQLLNE